MKTETTTTKPAFDPEVPPREGFIFYRTFYEALASMKPMARLHLYDVIMRYALYGEEPTDLNGEQMRTFILIRPQLDANERKRQAKYKKKAIKKKRICLSFLSSLKMPIRRCQVPLVWTVST